MVSGGVFVFYILQNGEIWEGGVGVSEFFEVLKIKIHVNGCYGISNEVSVCTSQLEGKNA